jgi:DnaJ-domain-containing protein 1
MHHAFADQHGDAVCYLCIARIIRLAQEPGFAGGAAGAPYQQQPLPAEVRAEQIRRALAALELGPGASWKDVRSKHRALAAKHHPDRQRAAADKLAAAVRCKAVTEAFAQLKKLEYKPEEDRR